MIKDLWTDRGYLRQLEDNELIERGLASDTDLAVVLAERLDIALDCYEYGKTLTLMLAEKLDIETNKAKEGKTNVPQ